MYKPRTFTVRGFTTTQESFLKPSGTIDQFASFQKIEVRHQHEALALMLTNFREMTTPGIIDIATSGFIDEDLVIGLNNPIDICSIFHVIDLDITVNSIDQKAMKFFKKEILESIFTWSEKSRVKNLRGWRCSAVKTPILEYNYDPLCCHFRTQVVLSNAIIYSSTSGDIECNISSIDFATVQSDLANLRKNIKKKIGTNLGSFYYKDSIFGKSEII